MVPRKFNGVKTLMMYLGDPGGSWGHQDRPLGADPKNPVLVYSMGMVHGNSTKHKHMAWIFIDFHDINANFIQNLKKTTTSTSNLSLNLSKLGLKNPYHDWLSAHVFTATKSPRFPLV